MAHFAVRGLMHEAALKSGEDPDRMSFLHAVRVIRRKMAIFAAIPPQGKSNFYDNLLREILDEKCASSRNRHNPRGVKRKISNYSPTSPWQRHPALCRFQQGP